MGDRGDDHLGRTVDAPRVPTAQAQQNVPQRFADRSVDCACHFFGHPPSGVGGAICSWLITVCASEAKTGEATEPPK